MIHNSTVAEVHWEPVALSLVRGKLQGYKVCLRMYALFCSGVVNATLSASVTNPAIFSLRDHQKLMFLP